jgi:hypothetical protein
MQATASKRRTNHVKRRRSRLSVSVRSEGAMVKGTLVNGKRGRFPFLAQGRASDAKLWLWQLDNGLLANQRVFDEWRRKVRYPLATGHVSLFNVRKTDQTQPRSPRRP